MERMLCGRREAVGEPTTDREHAPVRELQTPPRSPHELGTDWPTKDGGVDIGRGEVEIQAPSETEATMKKRLEVLGVAAQE
jgi:hypothetical protein